MDLDYHDIVISTWRWLCGLMVGSSTGLAAALLVRAHYRAQNYSIHVVGFFRALPILALVPVVSKLIGIGEIAKILLISWACFFPVFISTVRSTARRVPDLELRIFAVKLSPADRFRHYELPRILFGFFSGVEISVGIGWLTVVAAEFLGTFELGIFRGGLGNAVFVAFSNNDFRRGFLCLALFGVLGVMSSLVWRFVSGKMAQGVGFDLRGVN